MELLRKTAVSMYVDKMTCYVGYNKSAAMSARRDIMHRPMRVRLLAKDVSVVVQKDKERTRQNKRGLRR